jgi:NAD(P)-dependent dehydrogenase (short-subunit alcohol dehydrogenase family)
MTARVKSALAPAVLEGRLRQSPLHRGAAPAEAAEAAAYLVNARYATGTELVLDGGFTIYGDA